MDKVNIEDYRNIVLIYPIYWNQMPWWMKGFWDKYMIDYYKGSNLKDTTLHTLVSLGSKSYFNSERYKNSLRLMLHTLLVDRLNCREGLFNVYLGSKSIPNYEVIYDLVSNHTGYQEVQNLNFK